MAMKSVRDIEIHYELHGDRGPVVLLVHGLGSSLEIGSTSRSSRDAVSRAHHRPARSRQDLAQGTDHDGRLRRRIFASCLPRSASDLRT